MKKIFAIMLTLILTISMLAACGGSSNSGDSNTSATVPEIVPKSDEGKAHPDRGGTKEENETLSFNPIIVKSSKLITAEEAAQILGCEVEPDKVDDVCNNSLHNWLR